MVRIITGAVGIALGLAVIRLGGLVFAVALSIVAALAVREYAAMARRKGARPDGWLVAAASIAFISAALRGTDVLDGYIIASLVVLSFTFQVLAKPTENAVANTAVTVTGAIYIGWTLSRLALIRAHEMGFGLTLFIVLTTWVNDIACYFVGTAVGRHKLMRRVSPGKTIEGSIGGLVVTVLFAWAMTVVGDRTGWFETVPRAHAAVLGLLVSVLGQLGDLAESALKRDVGIKDSGDVLPGHGGMLDRFDAIFFTAGFFYIYVGLVLGGL